MRMAGGAAFSFDFWPRIPMAPDRIGSDRRRGARSVREYGDADGGVECVLGYGQRGKLAGSYLGANPIDPSYVCARMKPGASTCVPGGGLVSRGRLIVERGAPALATAGGCALRTRPRVVLVRSWRSEERGVRLGRLEAGSIQEDCAER